MWIVSAEQAPGDWLPEQSFTTVEQATGYMWHTAHLLCPDADDTLQRGGEPVVHFRVKYDGRRTS